MDTPTAETSSSVIKSLKRFDEAKKIMGTLISQWSEHVIQQVKDNREARKMRVDVEILRQKQTIRAGDTYIGVRTIDNNITKDVPPYIAYLKQSRRLAIFQPEDMRTSPEVPEQLEKEFTRVMTYDQWEFDYIRWIDGAELNGFDWVAVMYDPDKPGKCSVDHIGCENLIYDLGVENIQDSRMVLRRHKLTVSILQDLAERYGFNPEVVKKIEEKLKDRANTSDTNNSQDQAPTYIYCAMFKEEGTVQCGWHAPEGDAKWLRDPEPFWNGIEESPGMVAQEGVAMPTLVPQPPVKTPEVVYPYYLLQYRVTEEHTLCESQGRAEMDLHIQEAQCSLWSTFVNQARRSGITIWNPKDKMTEVAGTSPKQLSIPLKDGAIWDRPMEAFNPPAPDPMLPRALEMLTTQAADNINKPSWTVNNRKDSRKTATEIQAASQENTQINSVSVVMFSVAMRCVLNAAWRIVQSQALKGAMMFLPDADGKNQTNIIAARYIIKAAGDTDYIERQEVVTKMQQDWPVFQNTPMAQMFLEEYVKSRYPGLADRFVAQLRMQDPKSQAIMQLSEALSRAVVDPQSGILKPEFAPFQQQLSALAQNAQAAISGQQPQQGASNETGSDQ